MSDRGNRLSLAWKTYSSDRVGQVSKTSASPLTSATLFSATGSVAILSIMGTVGTAIEAAETTVTLSADGRAICTATDVQSLPSGAQIQLRAAGGALTTNSAGTLGEATASPLPLTSCGQTLSVAYGNASTGTIAWVVRWIPLTSGATLAAA